MRTMTQQRQNDRNTFRGDSGLKRRRNRPQKDDDGSIGWEVTE